MYNRYDNIEKFVTDPDKLQITNGSEVYVSSEDNFDINVTVVEIEIKLDYIIEDFAAYWYGFIRKKAGKPFSRSDDPPKWARGLGRFCAWFFIVMGMVSILNSLLQGRRMYSEDLGLLFSLLLITPLGGILEIAFGVFCLRVIRQGPQEYLMKPPYSRWVRRSWKRYQETGPMYTCHFTEDGVWVHDCRSDHRFDYTFLDNLWEDGEHFYLQLSGKPGPVYILPKRGFTEGTPEDLPNLWQERTGKAVLAATPEREQIGVRR